MDAFPSWSLGTRIKGRVRVGGASTILLLTGFPHPDPLPEGEGVHYVSSTILPSTRRMMRFIPAARCSLCVTMTSETPVLFCIE
jgi:hypothetical protein